MEQNLIDVSSHNIIEQIKESLLVNDLATANRLLDEHHFSEDTKNLLVNHLNSTHPECFFTLANSRIRKVL